MNSKKMITNNNLKNVQKNNESDFIKIKEKFKKGKIKDIHEQKILTIALALLRYNVKMYSELEQLTEMKRSQLIKYLHWTDLATVLDLSTYEKIKESVSVLDENYDFDQKRQARIEKFKEFDEYVTIYLQNYYSKSDMLDQLGITKNPNDILKDKFFIENYDPEIQNAIKEKSLIMKSMKGRKRVSSIHIDKVFIKEYEKLQYMIPEKFYVTSYQNRLLDILIVFFKLYGNIGETVKYFKKNGKEYSINYIMTSLQSPELLEILNEETKIKIANILKVEEKMQTSRYSEKEGLMENTLRLYLTYNGDLFRLFNENIVSSESLFRVLTDQSIEKKVGSEMYENIISSIRSYEEQQYVMNELIQSKKKVKKSL